eukprot:4304319-Ditylum_brightwellii.AAC.1
MATTSLQKVVTTMDGIPETIPPKGTPERDIAKHMARAVHSPHMDVYKNKTNSLKRNATQ